ncbi:MAG: putative cell wall binding repeat 2-containing protein [Frankiales bacterium]|nr:putative cell wall binding repeat 2-containing protein [Frankiales bacterium]
MNRIAAALPLAALLGTTVALASSSVLTAAPAAPMTRSEVSRDAVVPALSLGCTTTNRAVVTAYARRPGGTTYKYLLYVNGKVTHGGYATATPGGVVSAQTDVPNGITDTVKLLLDGATASSGTVTPRCGLPALVAKVIAPVFVPRGSTTAYTIHKNSNGTVTRWNPCDGVITVKVNPAGGGTGALGDSINAIKALAAATGLKFTYDGTTTFVPRSTNSSKQPAKVVIAWANRSQTDYLPAGAIGEGGWRTTGTSTNGGATWNWKIVNGFVVVDPGARLTNGFGRGVTRGALLMHELAHVAGLGHTSQATQVMSPALSSTSYASWGSGDRTGLGVVGASHGCVVAR